MNLQPLDLIFFKGNEFVSRGIVYLTKRQQKRKMTKIKTKEKEKELCSKWFSHVAMVISSDLYDHESLKPRKLYLIESTMSGKKNDNVNNIDGKSFFGVQIRSLDEIIHEYTKDPKDPRIIACSYMKNNPFRENKDSERCKEMRILFTSWYDFYWKDTKYDANPISLLASMYTPWRFLRCLVEKISGTEKWLFCSELIAEILRILKILHEDTNPKNVIPMDFLGYDVDHEIPLLYECSKRIKKKI